MLQTPLIGFHRESGARLVDFAGWEMPVVYTSIVEEHQYTRQHASFFDVSHMGRVEFRGPDAAALLEWLCTRNIGGMTVGQCRYSHMCREDGGILDDVIVCRLEDRFLVVCNASNREKLLLWWERQRAGPQPLGRPFDVQITDRTLETAMVAIQGPQAVETLDRLLPFPIGDLKRYHFKCGTVLGVPYFIARSGYTGEDGVEIILPAALALPALQMLIERSAAEGADRGGGRDLDPGGGRRPDQRPGQGPGQGRGQGPDRSRGQGCPIRPAGLGARDTLRLEAGMPLYGHELSEEWDSITAGQSWCVDLSKPFIGQAALKRVREEGPRRQIVGLELEGKRIARQGAAILSAGRPAGVVTSGTLSPTLEKVIAMGLLESPLCAPGTPVEIDVRGSTVPARVVPLPFYKRKR